MELEKLRQSDSAPSDWKAGQKMQETEFLTIPAPFAAFRPAGHSRTGVPGDVLERAAGIEPASLAWKARVLPLHNARGPTRPMPTARFSQGMDGAQQQLNAVLKPQDEIDSRIRPATGACKRRLPQTERLCFFTTTGLFCVSHPRSRTVTSGVCIRRLSSLCFQSSMPFERKAN